MIYNRETLQQVVLCIQNTTLVGLHKAIERGSTLISSKRTYGWESRTWEVCVLFHRTLPANSMPDERHGTYGVHYKAQMFLAERVRYWFLILQMYIVTTWNILSLSNQTKSNHSLMVLGIFSPSVLNFFPITLFHGFFEDITWYIPLTFTSLSFPVLPSLLWPHPAPQENKQLSHKGLISVMYVFTRTRTNSQWLTP